MTVKPYAEKITDRFHLKLKEEFKDAKIIKTLNGEAVIMINELAKLERKAIKRNIKPCVRLNVLSDIKWENIKHDGKTVFELFPNIEFYDYTKNWKRDVSNIPNYTLTYSKSEEYNIDQMPKMLKDQKT